MPRAFVGGASGETRTDLGRQSFQNVPGDLILERLVTQRDGVERLGGCKSGEGDQPEKKRFHAASIEAPFAKTMMLG